MIETLLLSWQIVIRNWTVYKKDFLANISPTVADPAFILVSLGFGLSPFVHEINGMSYASYLAPGLIAATALFTAFFECSYGFYVRMTFESVFKAMLTTPIGKFEVILGEFLWVFLKGALMAFGVGLVLLAVGLFKNPWGLLLIPLVGGGLAIPCGALGLLSASMVKNINQFQTVYSFLIAPMYFLSGIFFPLEGLHPAVTIGAQFSPFYHGVKLMQFAVWGRADVAQVCWHVGVLVVFSVVLGFFAYRLLGRKLIS